MYQQMTLAAGVAVEFSEVSDFFRVLESVPTDLELTFYRQGREIGKAASIQEGYAERFNEPFDKVRISSAVGGAVEFVMRYGSDVRYDKPPSGQISLIGQQGAFTQAAATVGTASVQLLAARANRRYLMVQNNDTAGILHVEMDGGAATLAAGVRLMPGDCLEIQGYCPTGAITAIGTIAANSNIVVVEG